MSSTDEDEYGDIADEDLIEALSQPSQTLPELPPQLLGSADSNGSGSDGEELVKKSKYKIFNGGRDVPPAKIIGATQADALPDSSPYRIRGPIYRKPRPEPIPTPPILPTPRYTAPQPKRLQTTISQSYSSFTHPHSIAEDEAFARELQDLPDDAFSSSPETAEGNKIGSIGSSFPQSPQPTLPRQRLVAPQTGLRQTTLFGGQAPQDVAPSQAKKVFNYKVDKVPEPPTHHVLNKETLDTWIYPINLGAIRDYQFNIVRMALFNNTLVALPTGLGKTFIAATVMYNYFRWTKDAQIVFVAPTKPLVSQQVGACFNVVGLPRSETTMLTGDQAPGLRAEEWAKRRVFFMTPQTLINDLSAGIADPKKIVLLVVDEAHRATGDYAYVKVVTFLRRFSKVFRVLALTATPGSTVETVQDVVNNLEISKVEIRTEDSIDIRQYVHRRDVDQVLIDPSEEIVMVMDLFAKALQPLVNKLCGFNAYYKKDPMSLTTFGLLNASKAWASSDAGKHANDGVKNVVRALFTVLSSIAHGIKLLNFHGIGPFFENVKDLRQSVLDSGGKGSKYKRMVVESPDFKKMMDRMQGWINKEGFVGHPKLTFLCDTILNHFLDAGEGRLAEGAPPSATRVIVFSEYRDSAEDITRVLNRHKPMIRASVFVGQADSKRSDGMDQKKQNKTIEQFKKGVFNVIVTTSVGEEGLDIGEVDLIVCYDASASPIRMLQRMGRTGRKRKGNIVLLLMKGKEQDNFSKAKDNYEQMQKMITSGERFAFRNDLSVRIIPKDITPLVEKRIIDIPPENSQDTSMPVPKRGARNTRRPLKKFHMPDGVQTGFRKASRIGEDGEDIPDFEVPVKPRRVSKPRMELALIPDLGSVLLNGADQMQFERLYQNIAGSEIQEVEMPDMTCQTTTQRLLLPTIKVPHGLYTKRSVALFKILAKSQRKEDQWVKPYGNEAPHITWTAPDLVDEDSAAFTPPTKARKPVRPKGKPVKRHVVEVSDVEQNEPTPRPAKRQKVRKRAFTMSAEESDGLGMRSSNQPGLTSSEGEGDDLMGSEQPSEDESGGESLVDFVVPSDQPDRIGDTETIPSSYPTTPLPSRSSQQKSAFELTHFTQTQEDDDLPGLSQMLSKITSSPQSLNEDLDDLGSDESAKPQKRLPSGKGNKRRIVEDDSDE